MSEEICTTYHYGILFKVLALMPEILKSCRIPYVVGGGTAIVKYLNSKGIKPEITDKWDSYDWDVYTNNISAMKDYIIETLTTHLKKKGKDDDEHEVMINVTPIRNKDKFGYQLSLNLCYRINIPPGFKTGGLKPSNDENTYKLQFMDIFSEEDFFVKFGKSFLAYAADSIIQIDGVNYYTPKKMLEKLKTAIFERSNIDRSNIVDTLDFNSKNTYWLDEVSKSKDKFNTKLRKYLEKLKKNVAITDYDESKLNEATEDVYENYGMLVEHFSYRNVSQYIQMELQVIEEMDKLIKMRLRARLLREDARLLSEAAAAQSAGGRRNLAATAKQSKKVKKVKNLFKIKKSE